MTDFLPESAWSESASSGGADYQDTSRPAPLLELRATRPSQRAQRRPAAALAANVNELLVSLARKRVPRLDAVRERLLARPGLPLAPVEDALHALHAATTALDFLAGRSGGERGKDFLRQGDALAAQGSRLNTVVTEFLHREAVQGPLARLNWIDLVVESASLRKRVRRGAHWLAEMDQDLVYRRRDAHNEVAVRAIEELSRRGVAMHERLHAVHRLCTQARAVHALSERVAVERSALCTVLQQRVLPAYERMDESVQPLLHAAAYRALVPTELVGAIDALHELQVVLTQAAAQILRLQDLDRELALQLAAMEDKTLSAARPAPH